jgi:hypothetical protein
LSQKAVYTVNTDVLSSIVTKDKLQNLLTTAVAQGNKAVQDANSGFMSGSASTTNIVKSITQNIQSITNQYTYSDFQSDLSNIKANQLVNIKGLVAAGDCKISDISQDMVLKNLAKNISNRLTERVADISNQLSSSQYNDVNQSATATGPLQDIGAMFSGPAKWIVLAILVFILLIIVAWKFFGSGAGNSSTVLPPLNPENWPPYQPPLQYQTQMQYPQQYQTLEQTSMPGSYGMYRQ